MIDTKEDAWLEARRRAELTMDEEYEAFMRQLDDLYYSDLDFMDRNFGALADDLARWTMEKEAEYD